MGASCTTDRSRWIWLVREKTARAVVVGGIAVAALAPAAAAEAAAATSRTCNAPLQSSGAFLCLDQVGMEVWIRSLTPAKIRSRL